MGHEAKSRSPEPFQQSLGNLFQWSGLKTVREAHSPGNSSHGGRAYRSKGIQAVPREEPETPAVEPRACSVLLHGGAALGPGGLLGDVVTTPHRCFLLVMVGIESPKLEVSSLP